MNKKQIKGNWKVFKGKLKQRYADLTDDDQLYTEGKKEELRGRRQKKNRRLDAEIIKMINGYYMSDE
ncbi:MAG TPA: general stress protein CsbD [Ignavibacteriales bacterium]|nr:general stress protein CsbD [Ignavibacteriales bacterium]